MGFIKSVCNLKNVACAVESPSRWANRPMVRVDYTALGIAPGGKSEGKVLGPHKRCGPVPHAFSGFFL